jgi:hypothetical protein
MVESKMMVSTEISALYPIACRVLEFQVSRALKPDASPSLTSGTG